MPQASLLSYFSKPTTSATELQRRKVGQSVGDDKPVSIGMPTVPSTQQADIPGIAEGINHRSAKQAATGRTSTEKRDTNLEDQGTNETSFEELPDQSLSRIIHVPHLPGAFITTIQKAHIPAIQRLTSTTLPVRYGENFFTSTLSEPVVFQLSRVVLYGSDPVGWIRCRLEPCSANHSAPLSEQGPSQIYIQALALLSPYRGLGLATILLDAVLRSPIAQADSTVCIYAHVWEKNEDALDWYAKRGFKRVMLLERYYKRLRPGGAWIVRKELDAG
ncbi:hypothetical protein HRR83_006113 [Exophiala dermatitidis]|nr:hypothetical protein HRR74_005510 [Exophiala dermatitidis]KAJ4517536.1 hypothetical protein HRR73_004588 [Exophiala dermatitidis]KAJ4548704.1 hypothetical protein HRR76_001291 [Exophiala dermatitidis]KAJ4552577.1 hypothetical protein HRR77_002579 [Exophiala dermatitidis]KAJ4567079.1 hypothetical protein HRR81_007155 [Exophiala dermatitidis]